jgi:hypothetical protein
VERSGKVYAYAENYCYFAAHPGDEAPLRAGDLGEFTHGEGEYVHDCEAIWGDITYGERDHWRNRLYSCYYCKPQPWPDRDHHGTRPVRVVGFENPNVPNMWEWATPAAPAALLVMQMNNGATVKSLNG